jgi:hypothetical protein
MTLSTDWIPELGILGSSYAYWKRVVKNYVVPYAMLDFAKPPLV